MNGVTIYMEGGGRGKESRSALRVGMDEFLRRLKAALPAALRRSGADAHRRVARAAYPADDARRTSMTRQLTAIIEREGDGYVSLCPELDIASQGATVNEARDNLKEALALFFEEASPTEIDRRLHNEVYVTRVEVAVG